jgi:hypothetical protein
VQHLGLARLPGPLLVVGRKVDASEEARLAAAASVREVLEPNQGPGGVSLGAGCWIVRARCRE